MAGPFDDTVTGNLPVTPEGLALRQRIALQMMSGGKKGYPKNLGEGLTAIGDALGERSQANQLYAQMAALERASAARGVPPAGLPATPPATPGSNDPATGPRADASPQMPTIAPVDTADASPVPAAAAPLLQAAANNDAYQPADALPPVQDAGGAPQMASADTGTMSDASPMGVPTGQPNPQAVRASIAQLMQARQGGLQQNPTLAGQQPAFAPSAISPDPSLLGSPLEPNRPISTDIQPVQLAQAQQPYQRGTLREVPITGIKPSGAPSEPVPEAPKQPRTEEMPYRPPTFEKPPRMADPGAEELHYTRAASDRYVLPSDQKMYSERAAELANKRKLDYDQAIKAYETRDFLLKQGQERAAKDAETKLNLQKLEDERQQRQYSEKITRHLGGRNPVTIEENLYKSRASVANVPAITQSVARARAVLDKMYTGPVADAETFLSQLLPQTPFGFDPARGAATQQFKTAMGNVMSASRAAVVGSGAQSDKELATLQRTTAADAKLDKDTIKEALDAAERLMVKTAIAHQEQVHNYAGNFDADRTRSVFGSFGVPGMIDVVPQPTINKLMQHSTNEQALKDFDETYHTPGLAQKLIERETLRRGRPR